MFYLSIHYADGRVDAIYFDTKGRSRTARRTELRRIRGRYLGRSRGRSNGRMVREVLLRLVTKCHFFGSDNYLDVIRLSHCIDKSNIRWYTYTIK